ncbi:MAG: class I tRNA ligase family protein, partial [Candidatus Hodarchaeales archaeon]
MGHVLTRVIKDVFLRYKSMKGFNITPRIGGWDCHGLPVEIEIEKELGINSKEEIEEFGIEKFNHLCKKSVLKYTDEWIKMSERVGFLLDMNTDQSPPNGAYVTMTNEYIESVWWSLSELYKKNLLFRGHKIVPYCARCGTSLSSHELALGYRTTKDPSIFIKFQVKNSNRKLLAWTTTPWTLISNLLLAVDKNASYAIVSVGNDELILAEGLVSKIIPNGKVIEKIVGQDLVGLEYESLLPYASRVEGKKHFVTEADFVTLDEGTGIVHCAPAFGEEDYQLCQELGVALFNPVDEEGKFTSEIDAYAGQFVKDADSQIIIDLTAEGKLFHKTTIEHIYPFCWRCDQPLLYFAHSSWFIGMSRLRKNLMSNNEQIFWKPEHLKHGRFGNFIDEAKDWALSRSRFWGTPLPIWTCDECDHEFVIGSVAELKKHVRDGVLLENLDLHKPYIDNILIECPKCKCNATREPYVIDTWYDSGSAFFSQWHYPFENKDLFEKHF